MPRPSMADTPADVASIFQSLPGRFRPDAAPGYRALFHWVIEGASEPHWSVEIAERACRVTPGLLGEADCEVRMPEAAFLEIETGKRDPVRAFMLGNIKVTRVSHLRTYDRCFYRFHDVPGPG